MLRYAKIRETDIDNAPGICVSLFVQGCSHHCKGCFNSSTWDFNGGMLFDEKIEEQFLNLCKNKYIKNICILGGEPMDQADDLLKLLKKIKEIAPGKGIWIWTGYTYEVLLKHGSDSTKEILNIIDVLVDGPFIENLADKNLRFYGSSNQRVLELKKK
jgi:anaerobic ribonucleoside-triphosphate reductase activating protein